MSQIRATVSEPVPDPRPAPPVVGTLYTVRYTHWYVGLGEPHWMVLVHSTYKTIEDAREHADSLAARGNVNVRIVTIPGDEA